MHFPLVDDSYSDRCSPLLFLTQLLANFEVTLLKLACWHSTTFSTLHVGSWLEFQLPLCVGYLSKSSKSQSTRCPTDIEKGNESRTLKRNIRIMSAAKITSCPSSVERDLTDREWGKGVIPFHFEPVRCFSSAERTKLRSRRK